MQEKNVANKLVLASTAFPRVHYSSYFNFSKIGSTGPYNCFFFCWELLQNIKKHFCVAPIKLFLRTFCLYLCDASMYYCGQATAGKISHFILVIIIFSWWDLATKIRGLVYKCSGLSARVEMAPFSLKHQYSVLFASSLQPTRSPACSK